MFLFMESGQKSRCLMVSEYRRPSKSAILETSQLRCRPFRDEHVDEGGGWGKGLQYSYLLIEIQRGRCFKAVFREAVISFGRLLVFPL